MSAIAEVTIDTSICSGHGRCYALAPELFEPDDTEGCGQVVAQPTTADQLDDAERAVQNCPEQAISVQVLTPNDEEPSS